jgi:ankyrin repeat protein
VSQALTFWARRERLNAALELALERNEIEGVRRLVDLGADVNTATTDTNSFEHRAGWTALMLFAHDQDVPRVRDLLSRGADVNAFDEMGRSPLQIAVSDGNPSLVRLLLQHGADPNRHGSDAWPLLMYPAATGDCEVIRILVAAGSDLNAKCDDDGWTPLMIAANNGCADAVRALLEAGADRSRRDARGFTALDLAKRHKHQQVVTALAPYRSQTAVRAN